jgi:uncharacterized damage-inducible protein DinB
MQRTSFKVFVATLSLALCATLAAHLARAQGGAGAAPISGFRAEFLADWDDMAKKAVSLAEAMPPEKFTWRPGEGVRSVSEIYLHIASGNFGLPQAAGIQAPAGVDPRALEHSTTDKSKVVEILKQSFAHAREAILQVSDADLEKQVKLFGQPATIRDVFYILGTHQHEHFGLCIAYARMNGVVPPWTAAREARQQPQKSKP